MNLEIVNAGDLRTAYLQTFDSFSLHWNDIVDSSEGRVNSRYARELLQTLTQAGLLTITEDGDGGDVWQVLDPGTYDDHTRAEAEAVIDGWLTKQNPIEGNTKMSKNAKVADAAPHDCYCGCGEKVPAKSFYRPGHDARHAGQIGREIAANYNTKGFDRRELLNNLPSERLTAKAEAIAEKAIERDEAKAKRETERAEAKANKGKAPKIIEGTAKRGKSEVIARQHGDDFEYLDEKGDWRPLSKAASKTFQEG